jgi:SAM-dependent methyltransferase
VHTPDGSAVELYEVSSARGEDELVDAAIGAGSNILELGCGTGRITRGLLALGHQVMAVDESADMIARVAPLGIETVCSTIGDLRLERRFDVVLMMSFLINVADDGERLRLLETCARHVRPGGSVLLQQEVPGHRHAPAVMGDEHRRMVVSDVEDLADGSQAATLTHTIDGRTWSQRIRTKNLPEDHLAAQLTESGLRLTSYLTPDRMWIQAQLDRPARTNPS